MFNYKVHNYKAQNYKVHTNKTTTKFLTTKFVTTKFVTTNFVTTNFVTTKFVTTNFAATKSYIPCASRNHMQALHPLVGAAHNMFRAPPRNQVMICGFFFVPYAGRSGAQRVCAPVLQTHYSITKGQVEFCAPILLF